MCPLWRSGSCPCWCQNPSIGLGRFHDGGTHRIECAAILLSTVAEVLLKIGAMHLPAFVLPPCMSFVSPIFSWWVALGIFAYIGSLSLWLIALPHLPLHLAFGLSSTVHLLVPIACWLVLHEIIPLGRCLGMILILAGTLTLGLSQE